MAAAALGAAHTSTEAAPVAEVVVEPSAPPQNAHAAVRPIHSAPRTPVATRKAAAPVSDASPNAAEALAGLDALAQAAKSVSGKKGGPVSPALAAIKKAAKSAGGNGSAKAAPAAGAKAAKSPLQNPTIIGVIVAVAAIVLVVVLMMVFGGENNAAPAESVKTIAPPSATPVQPARPVHSPGELFPKVAPQN